MNEKVYQLGEMSTIFLGILTNDQLNENRKDRQKLLIGDFKALCINLKSKAGLAILLQIIEERYKRISKGVVDVQEVEKLKVKVTNLAKGGIEKLLDVVVSNCSLIQIKSPDINIHRIHEDCYQEAQVKEAIKEFSLPGNNDRIWLVFNNENIMKQFSDAFLSPPSEQLADNTIRAHSKMLECKIVLSCISEFPKFTEFVNSIGGYVSFINCDPTPGIEHFQQLVFFNNQFCIFNRNSKRKVAALTEEAGKTLETLQQVGKGQDAATVVHKLVEGISINAHAGDKLAQYYLGYCCLKGKEVEQDAVKAVEWLQKAAEQKYYEAQYHLAVCYMQGIGVAVDKERALLLMS